MSDFLMDGITAYFDMTSLDIANNKWTNLVAGGQDMTLTACSEEDDALKLPGGAYGLCSCGEPDVIYVVMRKPTPDNDKVMFDRIRSASSSGYGLSLWTETSSDFNLEFGLTGSPYVHFTADFTDFHVFAAVYMHNANTAETNMALIYMDGILIGIRPNAYHGQGSGIVIGGRKCGSSVDYLCTSSTYFRVIACGTCTDSDVVYQNSLYLLSGIVPTAKKLAAGATAAAITYIMAKNRANLDALEDLEKAYKSGLRHGGGTEVETVPLGDDPIDITPPLPPTDDENPPDTDDTPGTMGYELDEGGIYIETAEITIDGVTGVFQLHIALDGITYDDSTAYGTNIGISKVVLTITGNGVYKTTSMTPYWRGVTDVGGENNQFYMTTARLSKTYPGIVGQYYWDYSGGFYDRSWQFTGDYAAALMAGVQASTMPFID